MTVLRFLAGLCLIAALIALVADATGPLTGTGPFAPTSLARLWAETAPKSLAAARGAMSHGLSAVVWNTAIVKLLHVPTFAILGVLGVLFGYLGRRRRQLNVYTN